MIEQFPYILRNKNQLISEFNQLGAEKKPFLFIIDYKAESGYVIPEIELDERFVKYENNNLNPTIPDSGASIRLSGFSSFEKSGKDSFYWSVEQVTFEEYKLKFKYVQQQIHQGNSFLVNLTQPSKIETNLSLLDLFEIGTAKYKLWLKDQFTVLSPETFVQIRSGTISVFPMKGTIDGAIPNASELILNDPKERAEHATIVDLIRNDLSMVAENVEVKRYRYLDKIITNKGELLQVSSEIGGKLPVNFLGNLGDILFALLPAGSICGAPKPKTLEIIESAEGYERGFYTGVCGWFDGTNLDSAVMIRFVEQQHNQLIFKSGGGITSKSDLQKEYEELIQKVYVPIC